jgi:3-deoxy-D-manno-octulosonic-acid transferase
LSKILYQLFLYAYSGGIHLAALWNEKAGKWVQGRKRFPSINMDFTGQRVWMHCASLGEFEQGRPVLESIKKQYPDARIVLTFFSPSGYEIMKGYKYADHIFYLPMDGKANAIKMLDELNPSMVLWVKYEFWYYYLAEIKKREIPLLMVSGIFRYNQPFFKWYGGFWKKMLKCFTHFFVQNADCKQLLAEIGIQDNVTISGDTRFDRVIEIAEKFEPLPLVEKFCGNSKVIVAGSTWEEDDAEWTHYVKANPQIKFIIAPHEIGKDNLEDVKKEFPNSKFYSELVANEDQTEIEQTRNQQPFPTNVLIIDNIGMLSKIYHYADITFVGGGFGSDGIHNVLEAAVYGKPVIFGPCYEKFAEAVELIDSGAGITINNALELEKRLTELWLNKDLLKTKSEAARKYVYSKAGATKNIMDLIQANRLLTN